MVNVKPIRSEADYDAALAEIEGLMNSGQDTPEGERLDVLVTLVQAYETEHYPMEAPDPIALIQFVMEQRGLERVDLEPMIGSRGRVSEVLNRQRPLTLGMIRRLHSGLGLPADALVAEYPLNPKHHAA